MTSSRERNPRGQGGRLRADILTAATAVLEETGSPEAVTLRAIARRAGISAPSIYAHFADREAIILAVIDEAFQELTTALTEAIAGIEDPVESLGAGCRAYLRFAAERPHRYQILFGAEHPAAAGAEPAPAAEFADADDPGALAFRFLVDAVSRCVAAGRSESVDPFADAVALWVALHGYAVLRQDQAHFPWPDEDATQAAIVDRLARIRPARKRR